MNKRLIERIGMAAVIAALVGYFCYQVVYGISETITNGNVTATLTAPSGSKINNFTIVPEGNTRNTSYAYPPPTITYSLVPGNNPDCSCIYTMPFGFVSSSFRQLCYGLEIWFQLTS